ncbi:hypothetical protein [Pelagicoccus albus]|uniref:YcxB-like protein n=1 Tax=Pelagicoccus albus TaxID=415222 RepID=A0A7X1B8G3_9BACT|nr:hypothetical protein [Pelagicoccus albus]MBC2606300.1 hypothetical protein [Pelagicoccus albus]
MNNKRFKFENTHRFTEEEYFDLFYVIPKKRHPIFRIAVGALAILCFFSPYTIAVGLALFGFLTLDLFTNKIRNTSFGHTYRESKILKEQVTYGVSESALWMHGTGFEARIAWSMIRHWELADRWLYVTCANMPTFYFEVEKLRESGVLDEVVALCDKFAIPYKSRAMKELSNQAVHTTPASAPR